MGNCITASIDGTSSGRGRRNCRSSSGGKGNNGSSARVPREEDLHRVPGRIFSSDGRSRTSSSSLYTQQGRKGINQDAMILWEDFGEGSGILCGVFDGHGPQGHLVARKVRDALPLKLLSFLPSGTRPGCFGTKKHGPMPPDPPSLSALRRAFVRSYKAMDKELRSHPALDCFCSGSTAVTVLKLGSDLFMGNIGDSRAILGSMDETGSSIVAVQLTVDLKPDLPREAERIKRCRGRVFALQDEPEVPRVWLPFDDAPGLAMARAFGDFCLKDYGVISVPEFSHWTLTDRDQFVLLASDGVWDVLSNKEVVDIVSSSPTRSSAAKFLVDAATREWKLKYPTSKMDDCAVVCLYLDGKMDPESVPSEMNAPCVAAPCNDECCTSVLSETWSQEPSLVRNFTVRSMGNGGVPCLGEENGGSEDQNWSCLEGVTRVNSLVKLPRFSDGKAAPPCAV